MFSVSPVKITELAVSGQNLLPFAVSSKKLVLPYLCQQEQSQQPSTLTAKKEGGGILFMILYIVSSPWPWETNPIRQIVFMAGSI